MKRFFFIIAPMLMAVMLILTQCDNGSRIEPPVQETPDGSDEPQESNPCGEDIRCTADFLRVSLTLKYPDGQPVLLDSTKVFWVSQNRFLEQDTALWNLAAHTGGMYYIVDDGMQKELVNKQEIMRFTGYLNGIIVCERDVLVGADCCHVYYLGTESLTIVIDDISDDEQEKSEDNSHFNVADMNKTIPVINEFLAGLPSESTDEQKLEAFDSVVEIISLH